MRRGTTIVFFIGLFFVFGIGLAAYFLVPRNVDVPEEEREISDTPPTILESLPEGVSVVEKNGERILKDERVGYEMSISSDIHVKTEGNRILFYSSEPELPVLGGIDIYENSDNVSLEKWVEDEHRQVFFLFYDERQKINIGGFELIKIRVEGEMDYYNYFFKKDNKIVSISLVGEDYSDKYIESIKLIK